ncbi:hypothetical protein NL676_025641 [Syzygium grande]|nr:hypothetical protein NL676_025641 [Syzygium grande]
MAPGKVQDFKRHSNDQNRSVGVPKAAIEKDMKCFFCNLSRVTDFLPSPHPTHAQHLPHFPRTLSLSLSLSLHFGSHNLCTSLSNRLPPSLNSSSAGFPSNSGNLK